MVPWTANARTAFFTEAAQMGLTDATRAQIATEGIVVVDDLQDFDKETFRQLADNLRRPGGRVLHPDAAQAALGVTIPTPPFVFGAGSQKRLTVMANLVRYYFSVAVATSATNMVWTTIGRNFEQQWEAIIEKKAATMPAVPKISKSLPALKWIEAMEYFFIRVYGCRYGPLAYVVRLLAAVDPTAPARVTNCPHGIGFDSIAQEMIARLSHNHPKFREDNALVFDLIEEGVRGTTLGACIKQYARAKDGRGAFATIRSQHAGTDKWEAVVKTNELIINTHKWKGANNFTLDSFVTSHRNAYSELEAAAQHIPCQVPNEHTRVGKLLDAILSPDAALRSAMGHVVANAAMRSDFNASVAHLLQFDPVAARRSSKRNAAQISGVSAANVSSSDLGDESGIGPKTGVHFRYHSAEEYTNLPAEQQDELREWRKSLKKNPKKQKGNPKGKNGKAKGGGGGKFATKSTKVRFNKQVASLVKKTIDAHDKKTTAAEDNAKAYAIIADAMASIAKDDDSKSKKSETDAVITVASILRRAKEGGGSSKKE